MNVMAAEPQIETHRIRVATRGSDLALWQANHVAQLLQAVEPGLAVELCTIKTVGDQNQHDPLAQFGGQGVFTREIQQAVLEDSCDIAVHSLKDLPTVPVPGLVLAGVPQRAPRFDVLISQTPISGLDELPPEARVGTSSPRRAAQLLHARGDLVITGIRGNVETRLRKLQEGDYDAIILAEAGLRRLRFDEHITCRLSPPVMLPAVGQGAIGIECRDNDATTRDLLQRVTDQQTWTEVLAERRCLFVLQAGCHAPVGVVSSVIGDELTLTGVVLDAAGTIRIEHTASDATTNPEQLGETVAQALLMKGAAELIHQSD